MSAYDYYLKILIFGSDEVKSNEIQLRFCGLPLSQGSKQNDADEIDFVTGEEKIENLICKLQLWLSPTTDLRTITSAYYQNVNGLLFVYDITSKKSFEDLQQIIENLDIDMVLDSAGGEVVCAILGNSCDRENEREVDKETAEQVATKYGMKFYEVSSSTNINIQEVKQELLRHMIPFEDDAKRRKRNCLIL